MRNFVKHFIRAQKGSLSRWLFIAVLAGLPASVHAISTTVTWVPSPDTNVTSYTLYYGTGSRNYTQSLPVQTNQAVITGLSAGTTYFFAAKSNDANGNQGAYSTEATFAGYLVAPESRLNFKTVSPTNTDHYTFSLASGAPSGASVNPSNGIVSWSPDYTYANTTNSIEVTVTDVTTPAASRQMTFLVAVSDYLVLSMPSVAAQTGESTNLPLTLACSDGVTNLSFTIAWPSQSLQYPTLRFYPPIAGGSFDNQGDSIVVQLWTANGDSIVSNTPFASLNFNVAPGLTSDFVRVPLNSVTANKSSGASFVNCAAQAGEVVVVGNNPLLRASAGTGTRNLTLYADPAYSYELDCATNLTPPVQWNVVQEYSPTNLQQTLAADPSTPVIFYRLTQL